MARKRKSDQSPSSEIITTVAEPPTVETPTTVVETQPTDFAVPTTFAEKVGQKQRVPDPDPFGIATDNLAGVRLLDSKQDHQVAIKFFEKPSQAVIDRMKEAGYQYNPTHQIWAHPVRPESALGTRIAAEKLYQEVRQMIREEKGIENGPEVPF